MEEKKSKHEKDSMARQIELDRWQMELEERMLKAEKEQAEKKLEAEQRREDRSIRLEEKKSPWEKEKSEKEADYRYRMQMAFLLPLAMRNGYNLEELEQFVALVTKK